MTVEHYATTDYGFEWGPAIVDRVVHIKGRGYVLRISTAADPHGMQVYISEKGRSVRVWYRGEELTRGGRKR